MNERSEVKCFSTKKIEDVLSLDACTSTGKVKAGRRGGDGDWPGLSILTQMLFIIADKAKARAEDEMNAVEFNRKKI